jgi:hypothetical protein
VAQSATIARGMPAVDPPRQPPLRLIPRRGEGFAIDASVVKADANRQRAPGNRALGNQQLVAASWCNRQVDKIRGTQVIAT